MHVLTYITNQTKEFWQKNGTKVYDKSLQIQFKHLVLPEVNILLDALDEEVIVITYNQLAKYLDEAEKKGRDITKHILSLEVQRQERESTPLEKIALEDKSWFEEVEVMAEKAVKTKDANLKQ